jgi:hypothetical protein
MSDEQQAQPDDREPSRERQEEVRAVYEANVKVGKPPYAGIMTWAGYETRPNTLIVPTTTVWPERCTRQCYQVTRYLQFRYLARVSGTCPARPERRLRKIEAVCWHARIDLPPETRLLRTFGESRGR